MSFDINFDMRFSMDVSLGMRRGDGFGMVLDLDTASCQGRRQLKQYS
jgi:hypothetical protein